MQNFDDAFAERRRPPPPVASFRSSRAILFGPTGGIVGYAATSYGNGDAGGAGGGTRP